MSDERIALVAGKKSEVRCIRVTADRVLDVALEADSELELVVVLESVSHDVTVTASLDAGSLLTCYVVALGDVSGSVTASVSFNGKGASCYFNGVAVASGTGAFRVVTEMRHLVPECLSRQVFKSVVSDSAVGTYEGLVYVAPHAQLSDSAQSNASLLLSPQARVISRPQLRIHADDVKAAHGATVGQLDPASVFYLQSRGFTLDEARRLLLEAFVSDVMDGCSLKEIRELVLASV